MEIVRLSKNRPQKSILHANDFKKNILLINISNTTYEVQTFISYTCLQISGGDSQKPLLPP